MPKVSQSPDLSSVSFFKSMNNISEKFAKQWITRIYFTIMYDKYIRIVSHFLSSNQLIDLSLQLCSDVPLGFHLEHANVPEEYSRGLKFYCCFIVLLLLLSTFLSKCLHRVSSTVHCLYFDAPIYNSLKLFPPSFPSRVPVHVNVCVWVQRLVQKGW